MSSSYTATGEHIEKTTNHHDYHDDLEFCLNLEKYNEHRLDIN